VGEPLVVVLVDELAAITAYLTDRDLKSRAALAIGPLCSQRRAVGYMMFGALQDPRKETLPSRGLFTQMIGLRLKDAEETRMVLDDGASNAGAKCHQIPRTQPGVGFMVPEDGSGPVPRRIRRRRHDPLPRHRFPRTPPGTHRSNRT
jgi:DNA segregation ATPase FtsK/SpoIIIE, S-DNA-T family